MEKENMTFEQKIEAIKQGSKEPYSVTPWEIANHFGYQRRSRVLEKQVNDFLNDNELELSRDFYHSWFYAEITMRHKAIATTKAETDPIKRVDCLAAANHKPIYVDKNSSLSHAITLMQQNGYSQLPVVSGNERNLCGYISWKTIGLALWHKKEGAVVKDYMEKEVTAIHQNTPLLDVIRAIASKKFLVVLNEDKTLSGIITSYDIAAEFFSITQAEAFLLLEQIELQIRNLIKRAEVLEEDLQKVCEDPNRKVKNIDDLTFGEYQKILQNPKYWDKLNIQNERVDFDVFLGEIREIRNDVMHFEPDGIGKEKIHSLRKMAHYLSEIMSITNTNK